VVWVAALQIMLDKGKELDWFNSNVIITLLIVAAIGFVCFMIWELTDKTPVVSLTVFKYRGFAVAAMIMPLVYGSFFASVVLVPLWLQTNMGYTAMQSGELTAFNGVLAVVMSPIVAQLTRRIDSRALICFGVSLLACVMFWRSSFASNITFDQMIWAGLATGFAMPFFFVPLMGLALGAVKPEETASAAGLISFARTLAGAFGTSIVTSSWENASTRVRATTVGQLHDATGALNTMGRAGFSPGAALDQLDYMVQSQSVMVATNHIFQTIGAIMLVAAATVWLAPKPKPGGAPAGGGGH
jgi:DHA2 family multidrug resistance protein